MSQTPVRSGFPSGMRGTCPAGAAVASAFLSRAGSSHTPIGFFEGDCPTGGATGSDCPQTAVDARENAANAAAQIKYMWKWSFTGKPSKPRPDGTEPLRVLLYHCEVHVSPAFDFVRRRHCLRSKLMCSGQ